jgi:hypothetical protein
VTDPVFGDLHGRVLPAFRQVAAWRREHGERLSGLLQVGDPGNYPDAARLERAARNHAKKDPMELGVQQAAAPNPKAAAFADPERPAAPWFTPGNHEDYDALERTAHGAGSTPDDFPLDTYGRIAERSANP